MNADTGRLMKVDSDAFDPRPRQAMWRPVAGPLQRASAQREPGPACAVVR
nr:hypothetical protein [Dyella sp. ASV24]